MFLRDNSMAAETWPLIEQEPQQQEQEQSGFSVGQHPTHRSLCSGNRRGMERTASRRVPRVYLLLYIQSGQVSLVASSENEIERSPRARIVPYGLDGRGRLEMFVAIIICLRSHRYRRSPYILLFLLHLLPRRSVPPLLISLFCLSVFLPRFPTCLARVSFPSAFRRTCTELSGCLRDRTGRLRKS